MRICCGRIMMAGVVWLCVGCGGETTGFVDDANPPTPKPSDSTNDLESCPPEIGDLAFGAGNDSIKGDFIQIAFSYTLACDAKAVGSTVRVKLTDLDADDPESDEAQVTYDLPVKNDGGEVCLIDASGTMYVNFGNIDTERTYGFDVRLIDSEGLMSDSLKGEAVYAELEADALDDCQS